MSWSASDTSSSHRAHIYLDTITATPALTTRTNTTSSNSSVSPVTEEVPKLSQLGDQRRTSVDHSTENIAEHNRERGTVASACTQCRSKHLKCDGQSPCSRCSSNTLQCVYVRSRRGFKGPRRNGTQSRHPPTSSTAEEQISNMIGASTARRSPTTSTGQHTPIEHPTLPQLLDLPLFDPGQNMITFPTKQLPPNMSLAERCIEAYFFHFHPAHPMSVPREYFMQLRSQRNLCHLEAAMRFVGSFFIPQASTLTLAAEARRVLQSPTCPQDAFRVQAMIIMCIGSDGNTNQEDALNMILNAQHEAIDLGMNRRDFAVLHADGSPILAESFRRTWWELFIIDGMIAGVHQKSNFPMKDVPADVVLPCEELEYITGNIPHGRSWNDFENEGFDGQDFVYSSFTYRIAAMKNMGHVLAAESMLLPNEEVIGRLDARLVAWRLHLPETKRDFINPDGQLDEMLFQAHMITEATTILLHRDHSELDSSITRSINSCAPHKEILGGQSFNTHAAKTIKAAQAISKLITLPVPLVKHTHFFTCVITLASIVHLMCWGAMMPLTYDDDLKQQLRLSTGSLKTLWQVWPAAGRTFGQVKSVAQDMYAAKKQAMENGYWNTLTHDEVIRSLIEDEGIMTDLQLLTE